MRFKVLSAVLILCVLIVSVKTVKLYFEIIFLEGEVVKEKESAGLMSNDTEFFRELVLTESINKSDVESVTYCGQCSLGSYEWTDSTVQFSNYRLCFHDDTLVRIIPTYLESKR